MMALGAWALYAPGATDETLSSPLVCSLGAGAAGVVAVNFLVPFLRFLKATLSGAAYPLNGFPGIKPGWWAAVFHFYVHASLALWAFQTVRAVRANERAATPQFGLTLGGSVACTVLFAAALDTLCKIVNRPVKAWLKAQRAAK